MIASEFVDDVARSSVRDAPSQDKETPAGPREAETIQVTRSVHKRAETLRTIRMSSITLEDALTNG
jgi:hypothetical protein